MTSGSSIVVSVQNTDVLVREKSVSRAAERLFLGQPAMSGALARLREVLQDEILV
jgi:DNA-binding transcriptional LysR family regulator